MSSIFKMRSQLLKIDKNIGYAHVIPDNPVFDDNSLTKYGLQLVGSPLSYQLPPIDINFMTISNLVKLTAINEISIEQLPDYLPVVLLDWNFKIFENVTPEKNNFLQTLMITHTESHIIEKSTRKQRESKEWQQYRKNRLTSTPAHKVFIRKKNFDMEAKQLHNSKPFHEQCVKQALNHGINNEDAAKEKYCFIMNYRLMRNVKIREVGIIIQTKLFWLGASPDGVIFDKQNIPHIGLLETKCPYTKRNSSIEDIVNDNKFYIGLTPDGKPYLKKGHQFGYYTQVQIAMGLAGLEWCHFVVYVYNGLIIIKVDFDRDYYKSVVQKMKTFYKDFYINEISLKEANN